MYEQYAPDLGEHLKCIGRVPRYYNPKEVNYDDQVVDRYLRSVGEDPLAYSSYAVTNKRAGQSGKALQRYNRPSNLLSPVIEKYYKIAGSWLDHEFGIHVKGSEVVSYDAAREWVRDDTSCGMPWTERYATKLDYHLSDDGDFFSKYWDVLHTPDYIRSLCSVSEKIELRAAEKVSDGIVRTTICMDVNHVIAQHMMCHDLDAALIKTHRHHMIKLGLDSFRGGFDDLNRFMTKFGPGANVIELDGKQFDGRTLPVHFDQIRQFRFRMLAAHHQTQENSDRLRNLYTELVSAPFVDVDGFVYSRGVGNPSGQKCTTSDNSFKNFMDLAVLFMLASGYTEYYQFKCLINACIVGDDLNIEVHPDIHHIFNAAVIQRLMSQINMEYHFASMDFRKNSECTFLGHSYRYNIIPDVNIGMYLPCIDGHKMRCSLLRFNESQTAEMTIIRACALRTETFPDPRERRWFAQLIEHLLRKYPPSLPEYASAWKNYKTDHDLWVLFSGCL